MKAKSPPWKKRAPTKAKHKALTAKQKTAAKARAAKAGRSYPNLVDNMWASKSSKSK